METVAFHAVSVALLATTSDVGLLAAAPSIAQFVGVFFAFLTRACYDMCLFKGKTSNFKGTICFCVRACVRACVCMYVCVCKGNFFFYLTTLSKHYIYGYMASDIWLKIILIVRKETRCRHMGYSFRLTAMVLLYAPSLIQYSTYHGLCCASRGALAGTINSSVGPPHEGSIRRPTAP